MEYKLIDSGDAYKLESFAGYTLHRPCSQAIWAPSLSKKIWEEADATFSRKEGEGWKVKRSFPKDWKVKISDILFKLNSTDFGHLGVFPEHSFFWDWMQKKLEARKNPTVLNLFAYTGGASFAAAKSGASVCHVDASKASVAWARENCELNGLSKAPIRWIVDDVIKFLKREITRGRKYDGIILDPPTFGRGSQGEIFKIERDLPLVLSLCKELLSQIPLFWIVSCHTPTISPLCLSHMMQQNKSEALAQISYGELLLGKGVLPPAVPCGSYALAEVL